MTTKTNTHLKITLFQTHDEALDEEKMAEDEDERKDAAEAENLPAFMEAVNLDTPCDFVFLKALPLTDIANVHGRVVGHGKELGQISWSPMTLQSLEAVFHQKEANAVFLTLFVRAVHVQVAQDAAQAQDTAQDVMYILIEDETRVGHSQKLSLSELSHLVKNGNQGNLKACILTGTGPTQDLNRVAKALHEGGLAHVVVVACCKTKTNESLLDHAALTFEKAFYRSMLARGNEKTDIQEAFQEALQQTRACHGVEKAAKFRLSRKAHKPPILFQSLPRYFVWRNQQTLQLIDRILNSFNCKVTLVKGEKTGVGKTEIVKAACHYLYDRLHFTSLRETVTEIVWLSTDEQSIPELPWLYGSYSVYNHARQIFDIIIESHSQNANAAEEAIESHCNELVRFLRHRTTLLVVDTKGLHLLHQAKSLARFLEKLVSQCSHIRLLLIVNNNLPMTLDLPSNQVTVSPLSLEESVKVFCSTFFIESYPIGLDSRTRISYTHLYETLLERTQFQRKNGQSSHLLKVLSSGIPREILQIASAIDLEELESSLASPFNSDQLVAYASIPQIPQPPSLVTIPDRLCPVVVLTATPLGFKDKATYNFFPLRSNGVERDQRLIKDVLKTAADAPICDVLTKKNLMDWWTGVDPVILHLSCHGNPSYLAIEDPAQVGLMSCLTCTDVYKLPPNENVRLVFLSACHSENMARAFSEVGVPNVVYYTETPCSDAVTTFLKAFYYRLTKNGIVRNAFKNATSHVQMLFDSDEAQKFALLSPQGKDKEVALDKGGMAGMRSGIMPELLSNKPDAAISFPPPPSMVVGRLKEMQELIETLISNRLVTLRGPTGIGKRTLAKALCDYLHTRIGFGGFWSDGIDWYASSAHQDHTRHIITGLSLPMTMIFNRDVSAGDFLNRIEEHLADANERLRLGRFLVVVDANDLSKDSMTKLSMLLSMLLEHSQQARFLIVCQEDANPSFGDGAAAAWTTPFALGPTDLEDNLDLLEAHVPRSIFNEEISGISCSSELKNQIMDALLQESFHISSSPCCQDFKRKLTNEIYDMIGNGVPEEIIRKGRSMASQTVQRLQQLLRLLIS
jgi:CHAT domain